MPIISINTEGYAATAVASTVITIIAGEILALNEVVYADSAASGKYKKADKDVLATSDAVGITLEAIGLDETGDIAVGSKLIVNDVWTWTPGSTLYLSGTAGAMTHTLPTTGYIKPVGYAITDKEILFHPELGWPAEDALTNLDGDKVVIDWNPANSTPAIVTESTTVDHLASHLKGIDNFAGTKAAASGLASLDANTKVVQDPANPMDVVGGRLDATSTTVLTWNFLTSNQIRLFNTAWELVKVTTAPTAANDAHDLNGIDIAASTTYDVFAIYSSATAFTLGFSRWAVNTAGASTRCAAWAGSAHDYHVGDRVTSSGSNYVCVIEHASDTFATELAAAKWVLCGTNTGDFQGLYQKDGVLVSGNNANHLKMRWLGVIYLSAAGTFLDGANNCFISNFYNKKLNTVWTGNTTASWTVSGSAWRESNSGTGAVKGNFISATSGISSCAIKQLYVVGGTASSLYVGLGLNITNGATIAAPMPNLINYSDTLMNTLPLAISPGFHWITMVEYSTQAITFYGGYTNALRSFGNGAACLVIEQ